MALKLTMYDIIKGPVISDKAYKLNRLHNQLVLKVHIDATQPMIKQALEKLFDVKVKKVRTLIAKYTTGGAMSRRRVARPTIHREKRAIITLAEGYALNLFEQAGSTAPMHVEEAQKANS
jgi:large subunit ribosomal protein L23